jgi:hypothetical protein
MRAERIGFSVLASLSFALSLSNLGHATVSFGSAAAYRLHAKRERPAFPCPKTLIHWNYHRRLVPEERRPQCCGQVSFSRPCGCGRQAPRLV